MEEYIVDVSPLVELYDKAGHERHPFTQIANCPINGRIIRCKDCKRWNGIENALGQRVCERSGKFCKPNGFCAWGERREQ